MPIKFDRPTIKPEDIFIWLLPDMSYNYRLEIIDSSNNVIPITSGEMTYGEFERIGTYGIGNFNIKLLNIDGKFSEVQTGSVVNLYVDVSVDTAITNRYKGVIKKIEKNYGESALFVNITGAYHSYVISKRYVTATYESIAISDIVRTLFASYAPEYDTSTITNLLTTISFTWKKVPLLDALKELCITTNCDFYISTDDKVYFFESNSILNEREAVVFGQNLLDEGDFGIGDDEYDKRTKIKLIGNNISGMPIIYESEDDTTIDLQTIIKDTSVTSTTEAQNRIAAERNNLLNPTFRGLITSFGLLTIKPGEKLWISIPENGIHSIYKVIGFTHIIDYGMFKTVCIMQEISKSINRIINDIKITDDRSTEDNNANDMQYSEFYEFSDDMSYDTITDLQLSSGKLSLIEGNNIGTFISQITTIGSETDISSFEIRAIGIDLLGSEFYIQFDTNEAYQKITPSFDATKGTAIIPIHTDKKFRIKVILKQTTQYTNPEIDAIGIYYKI